MKPGLYDLYARLADGQRHNGARLAAELGISRAAIWKRVQSLRQLGLDIEGSAGEGYRLARAVELLDGQRIHAALDHPDIEVETAGAVDSTNARLAAAGHPHARALVAEAQTAGRGRRGRGWSSPAGFGLYLSLGWHFEAGLAGLAPLSLVVGLAAAAALRRSTGADVRVKWPNDLVFDGAKLGGCLVEISGAAEGPCRAIVGLGINLHPIASQDGIDQPWTTLEEHAQRWPGRNALAAALIDEMADRLKRFDHGGFEPFWREWPNLDALANRSVRILRSGQPDATGEARGIDQEGRLVVDTDSGRQVIAAGEVSVRAD